MPDNMDLTLAINAALESFHFSNYGYDELSLDIMDPSLDIKTDLTEHLVEAVQKLLED